MKCLIIGKNKLSVYLFNEIDGKYDVYVCGADPVDYHQLELEFIRIKPDLVFHCDEMSNVDDVEENKDIAHCLNYMITENIVNLCDKYKAELLFLSSAHVFDGNKTIAYDTIDKTNPINYYGELKALSEECVKKLYKHYIVRTSWLFDLANYSFINKVITNGIIGKEIKVVTDQIGSPTFSKDIAETLIAIGTSNVYGIYHVTSEGTTSRYEYAKYLCEINKLPDIIVPVTSSEINEIAKRPLNQVLDNSKVYEMGFELPDWQDAVSRFNEDIKVLVRK